MRSDGAIDWAAWTLPLTLVAALAVICLLMPRVERRWARRSRNRATCRLLAAHSLPSDLPPPLHSHRAVTATPMPVTARTQAAASPTDSPRAGAAAPRTGAPHPLTAHQPQVDAADDERPGVVTSSAASTRRGTS